MLASNTSLREFRLGIVSAELFALTEGLKMSTSLEILHLSGSSIGAYGAQKLGEVLASNTSLKELRLGSCGNGAGLTALAEGLRTNTTLEILKIVGWITSHAALLNFDFDIYMIRSGKSGIEAVEDMLTFNTSLKELHLENSGIS